MKDSTIFGIIQQALMILEKEVGLAPSSLEVIASRSFKPISAFFKVKQEEFYSEDLINELEELYRENLQAGAISRNVFNLRTRGIRILREVGETGRFVWKGPAYKDTIALSENFERIIAGVADDSRSELRNRNNQTIVRRFLLSLTGLGISDISQIKAEHVQMFLSDISQTRAKSMDDVVGSLRKLDYYLTSSGDSGLPYADLLMVPRARERKIYPCMPLDDLNLVIRSIDRSTAIGKRDYAILLLAANSGMRAGDIAKIKLSDIDWRKSEVQIIQGKTQIPISLPLQRAVGAALADYILNSRPESESPQIFLRSLAPFQSFKDGVSVACVLRRRMKAAGVSHRLGDGKTMHGIRRMLGTQMTMEGVPITTVTQILGHQNTGATRPYISLDIEGLREYALGFDSFEEGSRL
ncbi:Tyrosine recombinase XerC [Sporomusa acidovorans DSM 3132]|uniref:Tyrosine recombinase XerC n=2 Tax=Sporomusa TaxID=2375 RepID=A0ABZ3IX71_SPOA4|nr:tyrosine-type recombinase/integrase [Sporomusa acidovorans]OZC13059.1 tyrosine recombinase XerC [Sporomusa acidovorans DSM 3132]